ncbi:hypothetical protein PgNI_10212 [Pyricularia grisea]|uniref:Hydrophobin n=1 Tax=Pyricularia grisea TaxID=148305 RepID=A0A6P8AZB2_PYRGI|nr:hypothetical protein PgNI_10212 [Pyricularia grisea]TLD07586.1 hypothetical protein PgNI_10212 [Pyricularia grisea]
MRMHLIFSCLAGLVAVRAAKISPRDDSNFVATTGGICCSQGTTDPNNLCKNFNLDAFCCSSYPNNVDSGCDNLNDFNIGREVLLTLSETIYKCFSGDSTGFVGCANSTA